MMFFKDDANARVRVCIPLVFMRILFALFLSLSLSLSLLRFSLVFLFEDYFLLLPLLPLLLLLLLLLLLEFTLSPNTCCNHQRTFLRNRSCCLTPAGRE